MKAPSMHSTCNLTRVIGIIKSFRTCNVVRNGIDLWKSNVVKMTCSMQQYMSCKYYTHSKPSMQYVNISSFAVMGQSGTLWWWIISIVMSYYYRNLVNDSSVNRIRLSIYCFLQMFSVTQFIGLPPTHQFSPINAIRAADRLTLPISPYICTCVREERQSLMPLPLQMYPAIIILLLLVSTVAVVNTGPSPVSCYP